MVKLSRRVISAVLKLQDESFSSGLRKANKEAGEFGRYMNVTQNKVEGFKKSAANAFKTVGKAADALGVGAAVTAVAATLTGAAKTAIEMGAAFDTLAVQTGATASQMKVYESAAKEVFSKGYGENIDEVTNAIARVKQNMRNIDNGEIGKVTSNSLLLANTFDSDINEVTRGANNLMQAFGITADKAFDLFTVGGQRGLNFSNEMFDNVAEYSSLFGTMGYSAEEYFGILERGAQSGVYNLDYVNDVMKEFQIRVKDGSKSTNEAMKEMSSGTQKVWKNFLKGKGTVADVASTVVGELKTMDDQVAANQIGVGLFGTKWEDLEADAMYAMLGTTDVMKDFEGAMESASSKVEGNFKNRLVGAWRQLQLGIADTANSSGGKEFLETIATKAEELVPKVIGLVESAIDLGNTIKEHWTPIRETVIGITVAVAAFRGGMAAMSIVSTISGFIKTYRAALATGTVAQWAFNGALAANPIGIVILAVAGLVAGLVLLYRNSEKFRGMWDAAWSSIKRAAASGVNTVITELNRMIELINRIPGVNIPIVPKVEWGKVSTMPSSDGKLYTASNAKKDPQLAASYAIGSNRITHDQFANIHKDEMILPARQAQRVRAAGGNIDNIDKLVAQQKQVVAVTSGRNSDSKGSISVVIENIHAAGVTVAEVVQEIVTELKLTLANI